MQTNRFELDSIANLKSKNIFGIVILFLTILYIGTRPVSGKYFLDMRTYADAFESYAAGEKVYFTKDIYFSFFMKWCSSIMTVEFFFLLCAFLYIYPLYLFCKNVFEKYWFYAFLILIASFSFWSYGVNGIRNGIASSIILWGISRANKKFFLYSLFIIAALFHKSMILVIIAYAITLFYKNTKVLLLFWFACIFLSIAFSGFWESIFGVFGFGEDDRLTEYLNQEEDLDNGIFKGSFRWDFLLYSGSAIVAGWFYIIRKNYEDKLYTQLCNIYLITNGFWILVIKTNFSNRFAYLSWFMLGIIIIYPLLKVKFFNNQHRVIGRTIIIYYAFTYILNVILSKS